MLKEIKNYPDYFIDENGDIYSNKSGLLKKMKPWLDTKKNYLIIGLMQNGKRKRLLVHRLVALTFIPNPNNLPEVNHKDKNKLNCNVDNLEWCTRIDNLKDSYDTLSSTRNFVECELFVNNEKIDKFHSIKDACIFASKNYNVSYKSLYRYLKYKNINIIKLN